MGGRGGIYGDIYTGGPWSATERNWHINAKELKAAWFTLKVFCGEKSGIHIRVNVDNMTSVTYISKQGGKKPFLNDIAREIWEWAIDRDIWLSAAHIPGVLNQAADKASRMKYD